MNIVSEGVNGEEPDILSGSIAENLPKLNVYIIIFFINN